MRILHLLSSTGFHGAEAMTAELVRQQARLGQEVHVAAFDGGTPGQVEVLEAVADAVAGTVRLPCTGPWDRRTLQALDRYVAAHAIELVHSHKYKTTFYALPGRWAGRYHLVTTYHNWLTHTPALKLYAALDQRLARFNDAAVAVSTPVAQVLQRHVPAERLHQIDNGIDTQRYRRQADRATARRQLGLDPTQALIGFVGRLSREKGLPVLIDALTDPGQGMDACQVLIVGEGEMRPELEALIQARGLQDRVTLLGNRRDTPLIYSALDAFVLPSLMEAFPMVLLEALACGCPVVATDVGEVRRIVTHGETGLVVPAGDPQALRTALMTLLGQPEVAADLARRGLSRVTDQFSAEQMAQRYLQVYAACRD
ncbi:MAG TPA: glycosyltransferase family 4 protein [Aquabacterium sp.]|nr:glycosyltransferase family 4 protein [Aquabacterium sp.]